MKMEESQQTTQKYKGSLRDYYKQLQANNMDNPEEMALRTWAGAERLHGDRTDWSRGEGCRTAETSFKHPVPRLAFHVLLSWKRRVSEQTVWTTHSSSRHTVLFITFFSKSFVIRSSLSKPVPPTPRSRFWHRVSQVHGMRGPGMGLPDHMEALFYSFP